MERNLLKRVRMIRSRAKIRNGSFLFAALFSLCIAVGLTSKNAESKSFKNRAPRDGLWVTFDVSGERFRAVVTKPESIQYVLDFVAGDAPQRIPNGVIKAGGRFNEPWSWHLVPNTIEFADHTIELCDGRPSYVEENRDDWIRTVGRYCPWNARIVDVKDCRDGLCHRKQGLYAGRSPAF